MSAITLRISWTDGSNDLPITPYPARRNPLARIGVAPRERHCPSCDAIIYSARHNLCGVCGSELPADCRFTDSEALNVERLLETERRRYRAWLRRSV